MYEGIKVLNGGREVELSELVKTENGEHILEGVESIKIFLEDGAKYNENLEIMDDSSDVRISLIDSSGNEIFIILRGLSDILLANQDLPVFEVFDGPELLASFTNIEDLQAAAAGDSPTSDQTADFADGNPPTIGADVGDSGANLNGFGRIGIGDPTDPTFGFNVTFSGDLSGIVTEDLGQSEDGVISGQIIATDPNFDVSFVPQSTTSAFGTFTLLADGSWTYDLLETNPDIQALNNTESLTDIFPVALAGGAGGFDFIIPINGLNDQPTVENINLNELLIPEENEQESEGSGEIFESQLADGEGEQVLFTNSDFGLANLSGSDVDNGSVLTYHLASDKLAVTDDVRVTSDVSGANIEVGDLNVLIDETTGAFSIESSKFDNLAEGETVTIEIDYVVDDGLGFSGDPQTDDITNENSLRSIATITLVITGTNDQPVLSAVDTSDVLESNLAGQLSNEIISDDDTADTHTFVDETVDATILTNVKDNETNLDIVSNVKVDIDSDGSYLVSGDGIENLRDRKSVV